MNKDVIYIDVEDDITAIIGKVKESKESIVALVPPKRIGALQSAVNLRILNRVATTAKKRLVLITSDKSLIALAASLEMPVAKSLQSKPEIPEIPALEMDDGDDIIDGVKLPIGDHMAASKSSAVAKDVSLDGIDVEDSDDSDESVSSKKPLAGRASKKQKVPDFNVFRRRLFIGVGLGVLLIGFLYWAIAIAPKATVIISAATHKETVNTSVQLSTTAQTNASKGIIQMTSVSMKKDASVDFSATGTKDVGTPASGTMTLSNSSPSDIDVDAGSGFSNGDCTFVTSKAVTVSGAELAWVNGVPGSKPGTVDVAVKAVDVGEQCNLSARSYDSTVSKISADGGDMTGGVKKTVKVVTQEDVQKAGEALMKQQDQNAAKGELKKKFQGSVKVIDASFTSSGTPGVSSPEVGQEAPDGKAKLSTTITSTLSGISVDVLNDYLTSALQSKLSHESDQHVYRTGSDSIQFSDFATTDAGATVSLRATGQIGPKIDENNIKKRVAGKQFGDIQSDLQSINGVKDVEVKLFPFWLKKVPTDESRITVKFTIDQNV